MFRTKCVVVLLVVSSSALCSVARAGLLGYWPLDETSGTVATNLVPGGTNGILVGTGITWMNDPERGQVLSFGAAGITNYVDAGVLPPIGNTTDFTWSFWAYHQDAANNDVILGNRYNSDSQAGSQWIKFTPTKFECNIDPSPHLDYADLPRDQWIHHAVVKRAVDRSLTYYRNGVAVITTNVTFTSTATGRPFYMGGDKFAEWWMGRLDDVAIWDSALPAESIAGLADGTLTPLTAPFYLKVGVFDLADAVGGGDGTLPGLGGAGNLGVTMGVYKTFPNNRFVDGVFAPNTNDVACVIDGAGRTYDFSDQNSTGGAELPWCNGLNMDTDPSVAGGLLPDFNGDPDNHSLLSGHASKGITFDLEAVRAATGLYIESFTATIGDSRPKTGGSISYYVFVDGILVTNRFNVRDSEDFITVTEVSTGRYLSIAITDANDDPFCDHGYLGDPFLHLTLPPPPSPVHPKGTMFLLR
ncbi:MAG TPA: hypothetical protein PLZ60_11705 [Kiritimatiellia bacterium]|nr:hypothetical protein [Kiritimatiellia bacterium]